jgi:hypothetical protein
MFFFAASDITSGLNGLADFPAGLRNAFTEIETFANVTADNALAMGAGFIDKTKASTQEFSDWMEKGEGRKARDAADNLTKPGGMLDKYEGYFRGVYVGDLYSLISGTSGYLKNELIELNESLEINVKLAKEVAKMVADVSAATEAFQNGLQDQIDDTLPAMLDTVQDYREHDLNELVDDIKGAVDPVVQTIENFISSITEWNGLVNGIIYTICAVFTVLSIVYAIVFFFNNIVARCLVTTFPCVACVLAVVIIAPGILLSLVFYLLFDLCPEVEPMVDDLAKDIMKKPFSELVHGDGDEPLIGYFKFQDDLEEMVHEVVDMINDVVDGEPPDPGPMTDPLKDFPGNFDPVTNLSANEFHKNYSAALRDPEISPRPNAQSLLTEIIAKNATDLEDIRTNFSLVLEYGRVLPGRANQSVEDLKEVVDAFGNETERALTEGLKNLHTSLLLCVYAPFANALCCDLTSACAFWTVSMICVIVGVFWLEIDFFLRRRSMVNPQARPDHEAESADERELNDITAEKFRERTRKRGKIRKRKPISNEIT